MERVSCACWVVVADGPLMSPQGKSVGRRSVSSSALDSLMSGLWVGMVSVYQVSDPVKTINDEYGGTFKKLTAASSPFEFRHNHSCEWR